MKKILIVVLLMLAMSVFANEFKLIEFRKLAADFHAERNSVQDMDREYCAALKIETDIPVELNLKQKVYKKDEAKAGAYYFFVSHKEKKITIVAQDYVPLTVDVPEGGLKKGVVYYVNLEIIPDVTVTLNITPDPDRIILNNKIMKKNRFKTSPGEYKLQIEKKGFETVIDEIVVDEQNKNFSYTLGQKNISEKITEPIREKQKSEPGQISLERFDIVYEITACEMYEDQIVLEMLITNISDDRNVKILNWGRERSRVIDDEGNEFFPHKINFANKSNSGDVLVNLVNDVPTKANLIFRNINKKAKLITKFDLGIWTDQSDSFRVTFRDVPIEKK